jgi:NADP-dependent 3-hydroxy acid dehydrogenase YdfG
VTKKDSTSISRQSCKEFGKLDVIINNAGLMSIAMSETKVDEWERMIDINIKGVLYGIAAALPIFKTRIGAFY